MVSNSQCCGLTDGNRYELSQSADCITLANNCIKQLSEDPIVVKAYCKLMQNMSMSGEYCVVVVFI